jgi:glycosyltransferase involved in cell wall biosynthesis
MQAEVAVIMGKITRTPVHVKIAAGGKVGEISRIQAIPFFKNRFGITRADSVQAISKEIANELIQLNVAPEKIVTIPNGVSIPEKLDLQNLRASKRDAEGLVEECIVFLFLGRISNYKGIETLIIAWQKRNQANRSMLYIVGPPAVDAPFELVVSDPSIVVIPGTLNPQEYLAMTDIFVLPSLGEGMSNSLLEAMSCGKAVIVTRVGAADELIENYESGLLVEPGNSHQLEIAINTFLSNEELRRKCGLNALQKSKEYDIKDVVKIIDERYLTLMSKNH